MGGEGIFGKLPQSWELTTLGRACERGGGDIQTGPFGSQLHAADYVTAGIPSIMPQNIDDNRISETAIARITPEDAARLSRYLVRAGDIIYSRRGDVERRALIREYEEGWLCGTGCLRVRLGRNGPDPRFVSFYLGHPNVREWVVRHAHGATMPNLNTSILAACPLVVPPLAEQLAITHILGTLDDKIELNRRMNETLEAMARALFKSWFVYFDPVRAKAEGRESQLSRALESLFPAGFEDSELGLIPSGWSVQGIPEISTIYSGGTPAKSKPEYWNGRLPWISPKVMTSIHVEHSDDRVTDAAVGSGTRLVPRGSTLVMVRGMGLHQGVRISQAQRDVTFNQDVKAFVPKWGDGTFLLFGLLDAAPYLFSKVQASGHGTGVLPTDILEGLSFAVPPAEVRKEITAPLAALNARIVSNNHASQTLTALRDTLLPKLISGELRVQAAEKMVEAVA